MFYTSGSGFTADDILRIRGAMDSALTEASIEGSYASRTWLDAYSALTSTQLSTNDGKSTSVTMLAVGGDFFLFHPMTLLSGSYFQESDLMHDLVVIDSLCAWNLFGSNDCIGMTVYIEGSPYIVTGVVEPVQCEADEKACTDSSMAFMSFDAAGEGLTVGCYEALMPNPIPDFAFDIITKVLSLDSSTSVQIENSSRFSVSSIWEILNSLPTRSMQRLPIAYPYWENAARLTETRLAFEYLFIALFLLFPTACVIILLIVLWKHRSWSFVGIAHSISDTAYSISCKRASKKRQPKHLKTNHQKLTTESEEKP